MVQRFEIIDSSAKMPLSVGTTDRCAFAAAMRAAEELCDQLNAVRRYI